MTIEGLPWRGPGPGRPDVPLPPARVPLRREGLWRKQWRYVGGFSDDLMLCAARVQVGPVAQTFWAVWERESGEMRERTKLLAPTARGEAWTELAQGADPGRLDWAPPNDPVRVRIEAPEKDGEEQVRAFITIGEGTDWVESVCAGADGAYTWTRKRIVPVELDVRIIGKRRVQAEGRAIEDESCGYHPKHTVWDWSAGVGLSTDGREVGWNLVAGVNDPPERSERTIWVDGVASEPGPASFEGLEAVNVDGARLEFEAICERRREERRPFVSYSYRQPFGAFSGTLPGGIELATGFGVIEHHDAHW